MKANIQHYNNDSNWQILNKLVFLSLFFLVSFNPVEAGQVQTLPLAKKELKTGASFKSIRIEGDVSLVLTNNPAGTVIIEGKEKNIKKVSTVFENNVLVIDAGRNLSFAKLTIYLSVLTLKTIQLNGDGNISSSDCIQSDDLHMVLNGNIKVKVKTLGRISFDAPDDIELLLKQQGLNSKRQEVTHSNFYMIQPKAAIHI